MTTFATAHHQRAEQAVIPQASMPVGSVSHLPGDVASWNLAKGIVRMSKLQTKPHCIISLPQLPGSVPSQLPATIPGVDVSPFLPSVPLSPVPELTPAKKEFDRYIADGVCGVSGGINLICAWDVCHFVVLYCLKLTYLIIQMNLISYQFRHLQSHVNVCSHQARKLAQIEETKYVQSYLKFFRCASTQQSNIDLTLWRGFWHGKRII